MQNLIPVYLWLFAFICSFFWQPTWEFLLYGVSIAVLTLAFFISAYQGAYNTPKNLFTIIGAILLGCVTFSTIMTDVPHISILSYPYFAVAPVGFLIFLWSPDRAQVLKHGLYGILALSTIIGLFGIIQYWALYDWLIKGKLAWPLVNPNAAGALFVVTFYSALAIALQIRKKAIWAIVFILGSALIYTHSRASLISLLVFVPFIGIFLRHFIKQNLKPIFLILVLLAGVFTLPSFIERSDNSHAPDPAKKFVQLMTETITSDTPYYDQAIFGGRPVLYSSVLEMLKDQPLIGRGYGTFYLAYPQYRQPGDYNSGLTAHSDPLQLWVEVGLMALIALYTLLITGAVLTFKSVRALAVDDEKRIPVICSFAALGAFFLHGQITFHFYVLSLMMLIGFILAYWHHVTQPEHIEKPRTQKPFMIACIGAIIFAGFFTLMYISEHKTRYAQRELSVTNLPAYIHTLETARAYSLGMNALPSLYLGKLYTDILADGNIPSSIRQYNFDLAQYNLDQAELSNPYIPDVPYHRGRLLMATDNSQSYENVEALFKQSLAMNPVQKSARFALAKLYAAHGDKDKAISVLNDAYLWRYEMGYRQDHPMAKEIQIIKDSY